MFVYVLDYGGLKPYIYSRRESAISDGKEILEKITNKIKDVKWEKYYSEADDYICFSAYSGGKKEIVNIFRIEVCEK